MVSPKSVLTMLPAMLCVLSAATYVNCSHDHERKGWRGTQFLVAFPKNYESFFFVYPEKLQLHITSDHAAQATIEILYTGITDTVPLLAGLTVYGVDLSVLPLGNILENKGILVNTTRSVNLYCFVYQEYTSDAFAVLPTTHLSNLYYASSFFNSYRSHFVVASLSDNNDITITMKLNVNSVTSLGVTYSNGQVLTKTLDKLQIFSVRIEAFDVDLTGTRISSSKPVAVVTGDSCYNSGHPGTACSHSTEMVPPVSRYKTQYIIPVLFGKEAGQLKLMAKDPNTEVYLNCLLHSTISQSGEESAMTVTSDQVLYTSNPVQALMNVYGNVNGDPFLIMFQSTSDYLSRYHFVVFGDVEGFESYITVIVPKHALDSLTLNGVVLTDRLNERTIVADFTIFVIFSKLMSGGAHIMENEKKCPFGLLVHGYSAYDGYGLIAG